MPERTYSNRSLCYRGQEAHSLGYRQNKLKRHRAKMPFGISMSHWNAWHHCSLLRAHTRKQLVIAQTLGTLLLGWETQLQCGLLALAWPSP